MSNKPDPDSFEHDGQTYTLQPATLQGSNLDYINAAASRSRARMCVESLKELNAMIAEIPVNDKETMKALAEAKLAATEGLRNPRALDLGELGSVLKDDRTVVADAIYRMSPECESLKEAEAITKNHGMFHELSMRVFAVSGVREVGNSLVLKAILLEAAEGFGGDDQSSAGVLSESAE